jgi:hypothetical protein
MFSSEHSLICIPAEISQFDAAISCQFLYGNLMQAVSAGVFPSRMELDKKKL